MRAAHSSVTTAFESTPARGAKMPTPCCLQTATSAATAALKRIKMRAIASQSGNPLAREKRNIVDVIEIERFQVTSKMSALVDVDLAPTIFATPASAVAR